MILSVKIQSPLFKQEYGYRYFQICLVCINVFVVKYYLYQSNIFWIQPHLLIKTINQARSQNRFWGVRNPQKVDLLDPKKWTFLNLTPYPPTKNPFLAHFVAKNGPFGRFEGVRRTPAPPGYGPTINNENSHRQASDFKGCRMDRSDKVSLWYVALSLNTRFRFFYFRISNC